VSAREALAGLPLLGAILRGRYEREFAESRDANLFRGVYGSYEEALATAPASLPKGYDNPASAGMYLDRTRKTYPTDYPVLFWLQKLVREGRRRIFDLGGHIGVSYYAYRRYLDYPADLTWRVHDVPAVMEQGRRHAAEKDAQRQLSFADDFADARHAEILLAMGSLQYLQDTLAERLAKLAARPPHVIVNLMPLHERASYWTLQSVGTAFCPYRITAAGEFLASFEKLGYALVDTWENPDKKCPIPFHPGHSLDRYHGFYFRRSA
jgi:putative methyltransferase (TIGR04325 family)